MLEFLKCSIVSGQAKEKYCTSSSQVPAPLLQLFQLVQKGKGMTVNVTSQPAPQAGALLRLQCLEMGGQNRSASLGVAQCWFEEKQEQGHGHRREEGCAMGRKLCWLLKQGPVSQVLSQTPSPQLSGTRSCPCLPWTEHLGRALLPPSPCPGAAPAMGLQLGLQSCLGSRGNKSH